VPRDGLSQRAQISHLRTQQQTLVRISVEWTHHRLFHHQIRQEFPRQPLDIGLADFPLHEKPAGGMNLEGRSS
jgi:hypothetical protein